VVEGGIASRPGWLPELDGLRAVAILLVMLVHTDQAGVFAGGSIGVDLFFVLSGYLITVQLLRPDTSIRSFLLRRLARLWPVLIALNVVAFMAALVSTQSTRPVLPSVLYVYNEMVANHFAFGDDSLVSHTWSLSIEMQFYIGWALIGGLLLRRAGVAALLPTAAALAIASYLVRAAYVAHDNEWAGYFSTQSRLDGIFVGAVVACALRTDRGRATLGRVRFPGVPIVLVVVCAVTQSHLGAWSLMLGIPVAILASVTCLAGSVLGSRDPTMRVLRSRLMVAIGARSYSLYVWHQPVFVLLLFHSQLSGWPLYAAQWLIAFVLAELSFRSLERPARTVLYRWIDRHARRPAVEVAPRVTG
jgi:peptidoglycan/LPS O-acetylase OafA/YrhL